MRSPNFVVARSDAMYKTCCCSTRILFVACKLSLIRDMNINETSKWLDVIVGRLFAKENFIRPSEVKSSVWEEILYLSSNSYCFSPETLRHIGLKKHCSDHFVERTI